MAGEKDAGFTAMITQGLWKHLKRGGYYNVFTHSAKLQASSHQDVEDRLKDTLFTIYADVFTGDVYIRPTDEFIDGRFVRVTKIG